MTIEIGTNGFRGAKEAYGRQPLASPMASTEKDDQRGDAGISPERYEWIQAAAELYVAAETRGFRLVRADGPNAHLLTEALVFDNVLLFPPGRHPRDVLSDIGADSGGCHSGESAAVPA
ncbi:MULTISPECIES: hypothetical protein [unclassified Streptomyces]|uniref:hypothetical protein n=1 Tax=unclassified Streptomyces TaxID=2593676 RepID=UPI00341B3179